MGAKLGLSLWGRNKDWGFLRTECWGKIFVPKREEDESRRKLRNDEIHSRYYSPNIVRVIKSRKMRWVGQVAHMGEGRGVYRVLVGRPERKRPLRRPRRRWENNTKLDLRETEIDGRTAFSWLRVVSNGGLLRTRWWTFGFHKERRIFFISWVTINFSNNFLYHEVSEWVSK
jgi:hypothetical protein